LSATQKLAIDIDPILTAQPFGMGAHQVRSWIGALAFNDHIEPPGGVLNAIGWFGLQHFEPQHGLIKRLGAEQRAWGSARRDTAGAAIRVSAPDEGAEASDGRQYTGGCE